MRVRRRACCQDPYAASLPHKIIASGRPGPKARALVKHMVGELRHVRVVVFAPAHVQAGALSTLAHVFGGSKRAVQAQCFLSGVVQEPANAS